MRKSDHLRTMAAFIGNAYARNDDLTAQSELLTSLSSEWNKMQQVALNNRVWTNFVAILFEDRRLFTQLPARYQSFVKDEYFGALRRATLIDDQLSQISNAADVADVNLLLIKGAVQHYSDLYPSKAHRFMKDIDLYFEDIKAVKILRDLGYYVPEADSNFLQSFDDKAYETSKQHFHHMPSVVHKDFRAQVELHHHLAPLVSKAFLPADSKEFSHALDGHPRFYIPSPLNQLIIGLVHCLYGEAQSNNVQYRLRAVIETYLLYQKLTPSERTALQHHFDQIGRSKDLAFWCYLCHKLLNAPEFETVPSFACRIRYVWFDLINQSTTFHAARYNVQFLVRLLTFGIWNAAERRRLMQNLTKPEKRSLFFKKFRNAFGGR